MVKDTLYSPTSNSAHQNLVEWHPALNTYELENGDLLLLSETQEILLPAKDYPLINQIHKKKDVDLILEKSAVSNQKAARFLFHINQLLQSHLLIKKASSHPTYVKSGLKNQECRTINCTNGHRIINFSNLTKTVVDELFEIITCIVSEIKARTSPIAFLIVDDFLYDALSEIEWQDDFIFIKASGEKIWISTIFTQKEVSQFRALQKRILDNQPIRKYVVSRWPEENHCFAINPTQPLSFKQNDWIKTTLRRFIKKQTDSHIAVLNKQTLTKSSHPINALTLDNGRNLKIGKPFDFENHIAHYSDDGGSRTISASETLKKIQLLISPITGIITHIEQITPNTSPIKIYRTAFFKSPVYMDQHGFDRNSFVQICMGKGVDSNQSQTSALAEAIERYNCLYDESIPSIKASMAELKISASRYYSFQDIAPYSDAQYQDFQQPSTNAHINEPNAIPYDGSKIHWVKCWSISNEETVLVPLSQCFSQIPFTENRFGRWQSNGCAAGNTKEEATLQAILELIERDATAIWWYNKITRPAFDLSKLIPENLEKLTRTIEPYRFWVLDITNDIGVPVMAGIAKNDQTGEWVMGFGCHPIAELAAQRALTELCQLIPVRNKNSAPFDFDLIEDSPYLHPDNLSTNEPYHVSYSGNLAQEITQLSDQIKKLGYEILALDCTQSHIPLSTIKIFIPGLCHIWPQLANERLYTTPVKLNWLTTPNTESTLNTQALYI